MSLWTLVGISTVVEDTSNDFTLLEPAGCASGDLLVACIGYRGANAITPPSGWSNANTQNTGNTTLNTTASISSGRMDYIVRGGSAPALIWTRTSTEVCRGYILAYRPAAGMVATFDQASGNTLAAASVTVTAGTMTTVEDGELLVMLGAAARNATASAQAAATDPLAAAWTEHADAGTATGNDMGLMVASAIKAEKGATGGFQYTQSQSARNVCIVGAFRAARNLLAQPGNISIAGQPVMNPGVGTVNTANLIDDNFLGSATKTFASAAIGTAAADRIVFAFIQSFVSDISSISSVTIGGVTATRVCTITDVDTVLFADWWYAAVPTGTTGNVAITFNATETGGTIVIVNLYSAYGASTGSPIFDFETATTNANAAVADSIDVDLHGAILAGVFGELTSVPPIPYAWTNATEDYDLSTLAPYTFGSSVANHWSGNGETARTITATSSGTPIAFNKVLLLVSVRPFSAVSAPYFYAQLIG